MYLTHALREAFYALREAFYKFVPARYHHYRRYVNLPLRAASLIPYAIRGYVKSRKLDISEVAAAARESEPNASATYAPNPLETYFDSHTEGRGIWKWRHYFEIYHDHFSKFRDKDVRILEIGISSGGSLEMWKNYFGQQCIVYGVDLMEACTSYEDDSVNIYIGDQADRKFWTRFKNKVPPLDIMVDDGGHLAYQQIATFEEMFPHLRPGGVYLCEDVHGEFKPFLSYIHGLTHRLNGFKIREGHCIIPNKLQQMVRSVHLYPFVIVIEKLATPINEFVAPRRGTQWQPIRR